MNETFEKDSIDENMRQTVFHISSGELRVEGSRAFVEKVIEGLDLNEILNRPSASTTDAEKPVQRNLSLPPPGDSDASGEDDLFGKLDNVFSETPDGFQVIANVEEATVAKTARNVILLHLFGLHLTGRGEATDDELRQICEHHGCYDSKNFASHIKGMGNKITQTGSARSYTVRLTAPGIRFGKEMANRLQETG